MRWVTALDRALQIQDKSIEVIQRLKTGFDESITTHAVHELLFDPAIGNALPFFPALLAARTALSVENAKAAHRVPRPLVWVDSTGAFYPPAAIRLGIPPQQLHVLRPPSEDLLWAATECLRCQSVGAVVALMMQKPSRVEVRRLQLAAEKGGGTGLLLRPNLASAGSHIYAAETRWLVSPARGERTVQRWHIRLVHGQGRRIGQTFILEKHRASGQTNLVPLLPAMVRHPKVSAAS